MVVLHRYPLTSSGARADVDSMQTRFVMLNMLWVHVNLFDFPAKVARW